MDKRSEAVGRLVARIHAGAKALGVCHLFTGDEDIEGLCGLALSPWGRDFCQTRCYPGLRDFEACLPFAPERYGVHINRGEVDIIGQERVLLVGRTAGRVCVPPGCGVDIALMHGATVEVELGEDAYALVWKGDACIRMAGGRLGVG